MDRVEAALREFVVEAMPGDQEALQSVPLRELLSEYGTWRSRIPAARPRAVHLARELASDRGAKASSREIDEVIAKLELGEDLAPYLSARVTEATAASDAPPSLSARRDRDLLLADWGVHHLHLSAGHGPRLLFAALKPDDAYLIGVYRHGDWARKSVLERMIRNWPDSGLALVPGGGGLSQAWSDRDRKRLREAGIAGPLIEYEGKVWVAASLGMTLEGTPLPVATSTMGLMWALDSWRENLEERLAEAARAVDAALGKQATGTWMATVYKGAVGVARDGCFHAIASLP